MTLGNMLLKYYHHVYNMMVIISYVVNPFSVLFHVSFDS